MAIIKCPECGRQISDKAPVCPSCGVEIAGKITKCPHCGEVYFSNLELCPNCHEINPALSKFSTGNGVTGNTASIAQQVEQQHRETQDALQNSNLGSNGPSHEAINSSNKDNYTSNEAARPSNETNRPTPPTPPERRQVPPTPQTRRAATPPTPPIRPTGAQGNVGDGNNEDKAKKKSNRSVFIISLIFAVLACGIFYYFYDNANRNKEQEAYEYAMQSSDPTVLQSYLDTYKDADEAHRDSIMAHLELLKQTDQDWTNAVVSGSKEALEAYLQKYPNSPHKQEAWNKIDSIDWNVAKNADTADAYQAYLDAHADGSHIEEAENALKKVKSRDLQPEEKAMVSGLFRQFFQSINSHNSDGLTATCEDILSSLLGKSSATKADVVTFMDKLYKEDVANMNWRINNDYQIKKREVGDEEYEYQVQFSARQDVDKTDGTSSENLFKIIAVVSPDGKISSFNMMKVNNGN